MEFDKDRISLNLLFVCIRNQWWGLTLEII